MKSSLRLSHHAVCGDSTVYVCVRVARASPTTLVISTMTELSHWSSYAPNLRDRLADRLQTKVYPYLLVQAGEQVTGLGKLSPEQIEMVYWFAEHPQEPQRFSYSDEQYQQDHEYLAGLVDEISSLVEGDFHLTADEDRCKFCTYRSLCERGITASSIDQKESDLEVETEQDFDLDFDQIAEIEF